MTQVELNAKLTECGSKFVLAVTGAGATGAAAFFSEAGASAFIEDVRIPWGYRASRALIGPTREEIKAVCEDAAKYLAWGVWTDNYRDINDKPNTIGIGLTGKLMVPGERIGREHEVWISAYSPSYRPFTSDTGSATLWLTQRMVPSPGTRHEQEEEVSRFLHQFMLLAAETIRR